MESNDLRNISSAEPTAEAADKMNREQPVNCHGKRQNEYAWVCAECLCASCWMGEFYCQKATAADVVVISRREAELLSREHISWFDHPEVAANQGEYIRRPVELGRAVVAACARP